MKDELTWCCAHYHSKEMIEWALLAPTNQRKLLKTNSVCPIHPKAPPLRHFPTTERTAQLDHNTPLELNKHIAR